jgi:deoxyribodipyrimidine photolyase
LSIFHNIIKLETKIAARALKVKAPEPFDGTRSELRYFLTQMQTFINVHQDKLATEADKVMFASTYLKGKAYKWFEPFVREWQETDKEDMTDNTKKIFGDYHEFWYFMFALFVEPEV